ncbi:MULTISPECIES: hypothetical protein [Virgibacillus]|nr:MULTISPECIES: hypothetical protein [Virgibacillus]MBS7428506.1 hypothetical protein [Virgibacillus sp. 19R1-5]MBU8568957.1 hypothetical protein [Virgibacillus pantothenticus]MBU8602999.1 hypothetical protein [Virgibacillus pantothenticus]MBU8637078.1 hypothetical protein [Virgibacillus pantothenticus]MBU8644877.1 hypothetical protein [Virgibacillus pantothenticus]
MKNLVMTMACGVLLIGGFLFTNKQYEDTASRPPSPTFTMSIDDVKM